MQTGLDTERRRRPGARGGAADPLCVQRHECWVSRRPSTTTAPGHALPNRAAPSDTTTAGTGTCCPGWNCAAEAYHGGGDWSLRGKRSLRRWAATTAATEPAWRVEPAWTGDHNDGDWDLRSVGLRCRLSTTAAAGPARRTETCVAGLSRQQWLTGLAWQPRQNDSRLRPGPPLTASPSTPRASTGRTPAAAQ